MKEVNLAHLTPPSHKCFEVLLWNPADTILGASRRGAGLVSPSPISTDLPEGGKWGSPRLVELGGGLSKRLGISLRGVFFCLFFFFLQRF